MPQVTIIDEGAESIVSLKISDDGSRTITKTRKPGGKTHYLFEAFAYTAVKNLGARVPTVISASEDELIMTALDGETLDDQTALYTDKSIFDAIAKDLTLNGGVTFEGFGQAVATGKTYQGQYASWLAFLSDTHTKLLESTIFSKEQKTFLSHKWDTLVPYISLDKGALVHGDFALSTVFVRRNVYIGTIDYGDAFIGDPLIDLAYFRFKELTKLYGFELYDMLATSYAAYRNIKRSDIDKSVLFYMIYWAIERSHTDNLEDAIIAKFIEKTDVLIELLIDQAQ
jgi:aminoglycoside phosphotransferase